MWLFKNNIFLYTKLMQLLTEVKTYIHIRLDTMVFLLKNEL